jgi:WD40 repeat protein
MHAIALVLALGLTQEDLSSVAAHPTAQEERLETLAAFEGHDAPVSRLRYTRDGKLLVSLASDGVRVWDADRLVSVGAVAKAFAFDLEPGGGLAVIVKGEEKAIQFFDLPSLRPRRKIDLEQAAGSFQFIGETKKILVGGAVPSMIDEKGKKVPDAFKEATGAKVVFGRSLVAFAGGSEVRLYSLEGRPKKPLAVKSGAVEHGDFDSAGKYFAGAGGDLVRVWDVATAKELFSAKDHAGYVAGIALSPSGKWLVTVGSDKAVLVYDVAKGKVAVKAPDAHADGVTAVAFAPDGDAIATAGMDRNLKLWHPEKGLPLGDAGLPRLFECAAAGGAKLFLGDSTGKLRVFDPATRKMEAELAGAHVGPVTAIAATADGALVATAGNDGTLRVWNAADLKPVFKAEGAGPDPRELRFSPDGKTVYLLVANRIVAWAAGGGKPSVGYHDEKGVITAFDVSGDGRLLGVVDAGFVHLVDAATAKAVKVDQKTNPCRAGQAKFAPDGRFCFLRGDWTAQLVDGSLTETAKLESQAGGKPQFLTGPFAFSKGGRLATVTGEQVLVWDVEGGKVMKTLSGSQKWRSLVWSRDGRHLFGVGDRGAGVLWGYRE